STGSYRLEHPPEILGTTPLMGAHRGLHNPKLMNGFCRRP
ncbi:MAG: hypothetical protein XD66_1321, partial [Thermacetogenium phaeum]